MSQVFANWTNAFPHASSVPPDPMPQWVVDRAGGPRHDLGGRVARC
ncbi:MAG: hypothetical protein JWO11_3900 [Nocardioides sp.]|nr:hypothetical protein [Nocardioides sp.]